MNRLKKRHIKELIICLICFIIPLLWGITHVRHFAYTESLFIHDDSNVISSRTMHNGVETIDIKEILEETAGGNYYMTHYDMPNGDTAVSGSLRGATDEAVVLESLHIKGSADIYLLKDNDFELLPLEEGQYDASLFFVNSDDFDIACYTPKQYKFMTHEALEYLPEDNGYLNVTKTPDGFDIEIVTGKVYKNCCTDFLLLYSDKNLMDWDADNLGDVWKYYTMDGDNRWTYTGYYRLSPTTYYPTGENVYYRCQACYLLASFMKADPRYRVMDDINWVVMDIMSIQQNDMGFFPSTSDSLWLSEDFNIYAPYYDTRFNSDLIENYIQGYELYGNNVSYLVIQKYLDFYLKFAEQCGRSDGKGGIWIPDYWAENCDIDSVHVSLNHQLSELIVLYKLSEVLNDTDLRDLADSMLRAITNTGMEWVKENGDFEYCIYPDGSYGKTDYDELTYNDMFRLQELLEEIYGERNETIDEMMQPKLGWMIRKGVTTYYK